MYCRKKKDLAPRRREQLELTVHAIPILGDRTAHNLRRRNPDALTVDAQPRVERFGEPHGHTHQVGAQRASVRLHCRCLGYW